MFWSYHMGSVDRVKGTRDVHVWADKLEIGVSR